MDLELQDKVAIVTGGSDGIGKAAALGLAREGAKVTMCARREEVLQQAAREIQEKTGGTVLPIPADVTRPADIERVVSGTLERFGRIDILVNNAGTAVAQPFEETSDEDWAADLDLKLYAAIRFSRLVIPHMRRVGGGRIINVTTIGGKAPPAASVPTSTSRAAGIGLTKALSKELAKDNILVNTVCIGVIKSGQHERRYQRARAQNPQLTVEEYYRQTVDRRQIPLGRIGEAQEAGDVIVFLASGRASYLTGIAVNIDGGASPVV
ncbi:MAG: SDR family oxidoreductase [Dehalococcoidia bacterium]